MSTKPAYTIAGPGQPQRTRLLSGVAEASVDVRKACNGIKRMSSAAAAAMMTGLDAKQVTGAAERMAFEVLRSIGFDVTDQRRLEHVLPMMMEATSLVIADAAWHISDKAGAAEELAAATKLGTAVMTEVAKSRAVAKMVEPAYPADIDSTVALRLTAASAMAHVMVEIVDFDYAHSPADCAKEAGKVLVKAALQASEMLSPKQVSSASKLMLTQSLIQSAAKVYAAAWRANSSREIARLDSMGPSEQAEVLAAMGKTPLSSLLAPLNTRFTASYSAIAVAATEMFDRPEEGADATPTRPAARLK